MAIEKLKIDDRLDSNSVHVITSKKINEIIDYLNSQEDDDGATPEQIEEYRKQDIGIDTSSPFEQEPNKVELVPFDVEEILDCMTNAHLTKDAVRAILSKYGVPTQQPVIDWENPIVSIDHGKGIEDQTCRVVSVKDDKGKTYVIDICQYSELAEKQFFTPDYVNDRVEDNSERIQPLGEKSIIKMFLRDNGLIEE